MIFPRAKTTRLERKYVLDQKYHAEIELMIKTHRAFFSKAFPDRRINNIYFDSKGLLAYEENVQGVADRTKTRLRWYGETFGHSTKATLEYKIKNGLAGHKQSFALNEFSCHRKSELEEISSMFKGLDCPPIITEDLTTKEAALLNTYVRQYFISSDKKFRITIDSSLDFYLIQGKTHFGESQVKSDRDIVVEIKYDTSDDSLVESIPFRWPTRLTKSSKYVRGIELTR